MKPHKPNILPNHLALRIIVGLLAAVSFKALISTITLAVVFTQDGVSYGTYLLTVKDNFFIFSNILFTGFAIHFGLDVFLRVHVMRKHLPRGRRKWFLLQNEQRNVGFLVNTGMLKLGMFLLFVFCSAAYHFYFDGLYLSIAISFIAAFYFFHSAFTLKRFLSVVRWKLYSGLALSAMVVHFIQLKPSTEYLETYKKEHPWFYCGMELPFSKHGRNFTRANLEIRLWMQGDTVAAETGGLITNLKKLSDVILRHSYNRIGCTTNHQNYILAHLDGRVKMAEVNEIRMAATAAGYRSINIHVSQFADNRQWASSLFVPMGNPPQFLNAFWKSRDSDFPQLPAPIYICKTDTFVIDQNIVQCGQHPLDNTELKDSFKQINKRKGILTFRSNPNISLKRYMEFRELLLDVQLELRNKEAQNEYSLPYGNLEFEQQKAIRKVYSFRLHELLVD